MARVKKGIIFPRHVYKNGGPLVWGKDYHYTSKYVTDKASYDKALEAGFVDDFDEALFGEIAEYEEVVEKPISKSQGSDFSEDDDF